MKVVAERMDGEWFEVLLDTQIYSKSAILKTAYVFLDKAYFLFATEKGGIRVICEVKDEKFKPDHVLKDFLDEIVNTVLREDIAIENKSVRESIYASALGHLIREPDSENRNAKGHWMPEKDLDQILMEIEAELGIESESKKS